MEKRKKAPQLVPCLLSLRPAINDESDNKSYTDLSDSDKQQGVSSTPNCVCVCVSVRDIEIALIFFDIRGEAAVDKHAQYTLL